MLKHEFISAAHKLYVNENSEIIYYLMELV